MRRDNLKANLAQIKANRIAKFNRDFERKCSERKSKESMENLRRLIADIKNQKEILQEADSFIYVPVKPSLWDACKKGIYFGLVIGAMITIINELYIFLINDVLI